MTAEKTLKNSVRYYIYLMCLLSAIVLLGSSSESLVIRLMLWLFLCLVVYRTLYKHYFMSESERKSLAVFYEYKHVKFMYVLRTIVAFFMLWLITYAALKTYTPIPMAYANVIAFSNGLIYGFFLFVRAFIE